MFIYASKLYTLALLSIPSLEALAVLRCTSLFCLSTSSILIPIEIILFIYASKLCVRLCVWPSIYPSIQTPSLKALTVLRCISLFCLSTCSILVRMDDDIIRHYSHETAFLLETNRVGPDDELEVVLIEICQ